MTSYRGSLGEPNLADPIGLIDQPSANGRPNCIALPILAGVAYASPSLGARGGVAGDSFRAAEETHPGGDVARGASPSSAPTSSTHHETHTQSYLGEGVRQSMSSKRKKRSLAVVAASALCALAFAAVPAMASATELLNPNGALVPNGTPLVLRSTRVLLDFDGLGYRTESCKNWEFVGVVKENSGSVVQVGGTGEVKSNLCEISGAATPWKTTFESMELTSTKKALTFSMTDSPFSESSVASVTYISPATSIHVSGVLGGSMSGSFTGDFKILNPKGAEVKVVG
jgi:hypothetical protein